MKTDWSLSADSLDKFLAWLSADREEAGRRFEQLRSKLVRFFAWGGCHIPEELFDKTVDVASKQIESGKVERSVNPFAYCSGVARNLLNEYRRDPKLDPVPEDIPSMGPDEPVWAEREVACLTGCLNCLPSRDRDLVTRYHKYEGREKIKVRQAMAAEEGGLNTLRIKIFRIKNSLRECVSACVQQGAVVGIIGEDRGSEVS
jgi:DNA-directed RNA polymerase specialized sigma24 family protein